MQVGTGHHEKSPRRYMIMFDYVIDDLRPPASTQAITESRSRLERRKVDKRHFHVSIITETNSYACMLGVRDARRSQILKDKGRKNEMMKR
jgi:hypothetical protein